MPGTSLSPLQHVCKGLLGYVISALAVVPAVSRSNVLDDVEGRTTRNTRKGKEEAAEQRQRTHILRFCLPKRTFRAWFEVSHGDAGNSPVFHLVKILTWWGGNLHLYQ